MEGEPKENGLVAEIKCILFCEFDPVAGPKITFQAPVDFPIRETFDAVHDLIITKPQLYDKLISVDAGGYRIVGCPKSIQDKKYARNALIFNFVFIFQVETDTSPFEPVVQKIGEAFKIYERENLFLSTPHTKNTLPSILSDIQHNLNVYGLSIIPIDEINTLCLKITPSLEYPPLVHDCHVPVFTCKEEELVNIVWDLTIQQILLHINGFNHVKKVAIISGVDVNIVKECVQHLVVYGFVKLLSIFQYSNVYVATPKLPLLMSNLELQQQCISYVATATNNIPSVSDVFRLYCSLEAGFTVKDMCFRYEPSKLKIDERKMVQFGLIHGLIRHLQKFPVLTSKDSGALSSELIPLIRYLDGSCCFDEVCCRFGYSNQQLDDILDSCPNVLVCWK